MAAEFKGTIKRDIRDSVADWTPYELPKAPEGAPNVLVILYDDTGMASWSPYGGRINMPTLDRLAANGLTYTQWHTTSICSSTRSTFPWNFTAAAAAPAPTNATRATATRAVPRITPCARRRRACRTARGR